MYVCTAADPLPYGEVSRKYGTLYTVKISQSLQISTTNADIDQFEIKDHFLSSIEWKKSGSSNSAAKLTIYKAAKGKWNKIAQCLGLSIRQDSHDDYEQVTKVFQEWLDNANQLPNKKKYPKKWSGLIRLLEDSELGQLAEDLRCVLSAPFTDVRGNLSPRKV